MRIEAAHEADHHFLPRVARGLVLDAPAVGEVERKRLFREHVLARLQRRDDLVGVQRRRRHQEHGVEARMREHRGVVAEHVRHAELVARPRKLLRHRAARGDELGACHLAGEHRRVTLAEAAETGNADLQSGGVHR